MKISFTKNVKYALIFLGSLALISWVSDLYLPLNFKEAYDANTRSMDGNPGKNYWQNRANYKIDIDYDPATRKVKGEEKIRYFNNSPDSLAEIVFQLFPNLYQKGNRRDFELDEGDGDTGVEITKLIINGITIDPSGKNPSLEYEHTLLTLSLDHHLKSTDSLSLEISWNYTLNERSHNRMGVVDSTSSFIAYFFPRIAVYDDINGWNGFKYSGDAEFYNDFGDFDVAISVPQNYLVWATGTLDNAKDVLTEKYFNRYQQALTSDEIIHIIDSTECILKDITKANETNTWKYTASNISDFAFAISDHYLWDASSLIVDTISGRRVFIDAAYNKSSEDFYQVAKIARRATQFMSFDMPGVSFPYPSITVFNGLDAMEYPMMVNNMSEEDINETVKVTAHEILHSYLPFYLGINETKYAWMDEGFTSFCDHLFLISQNVTETSDFYYLESYKEEAGHALDAPIFTISEFLKRPTYSYNSYPKPAGFFLTLKDLLGEDEFKNVIVEFMTRWNGKHPTPYDFFFTLNDVTNQNLDWLINPWFYEFGYVDLELKQVTSEGSIYKIMVEKKGNYPSSAHLKLIYEDGSSKVVKESAAIWKDGVNEFQFEIKSKHKIKSVELLDPSLLDVDLSNHEFIN